MAGKLARGPAAAPYRAGFEEAVQAATAKAEQQMLSIDKRFEANLKLPRVARWNDPRARERFFSQRMSDKLETLCGSKCDFVVAALTAVGFDLPDGSGPSTVRGRRRMRAAK